MSATILVRALEHVFGLNPGEVCALTAEQYETEMRRARPRVSPAGEPASPESAAVPSEAPSALPPPTASEDRQARPRRARGER